jgi:hypothetical protein
MQMFQRVVGESFPVMSAQRRRQVNRSRTYSAQKVVRIDKRDQFARSIDPLLELHLHILDQGFVLVCYNPP